MSQQRCTSNTGICPGCKTEVYVGFVANTGRCPKCGKPLKTVELLPAEPLPSAVGVIAH